jgi:hypothetical protein
MICAKIADVARVNNKQFSACGYNPIRLATACEYTNQAMAISVAAVLSFIDRSS